MSRVNNNAINRHVYSVGVSGSGKSFFTAKMINKANPSRLLIFDTKREMSDGFLGCKKITSLEKLYIELATTTTGKFIYVPAGRADYDCFCELAIAWGNNAYGDLFVYIEEAGSVSVSGQAKQAEYALLTQGRAFGIVICYVSSGFQNATTTALQSIDRFRLGRQVPMSIDYVGRNLNKEVAEKIKHLKNYEAFLFDLKTSEIRKDT